MAEILIFSIFAIVLISAVLVDLSLIITLFFPKIRIWPPPNKKSWQFWFTWILFIIVFPGPLIVGILDWNSFIFDHWSRFIFGGGLIAFSILFGFWAIHTLSVFQTLGLKGKLLTKGPYQYTRNPQYVTDITLFLGIIIITNSILALITGLATMLWFILAPFTEEPWLRNQFGKEYDNYFKKVPRFFGVRSFR